MADQLLVTVVSGSPTSDGNRVLDEIMQRPHSEGLVAIVPKTRRKQRRVADGVSVMPTTERLVRMGQGCSCCTVRGDLMTKIRRIAEEKTAERVLIHTAANADLEIVNKTFTVADEAGAVLSDVARIDSLVTVVDARRVIETLAGRLSRPLIERIEAANVVLFDDDTDLSPEAMDQVLASVRAINPGARLIQTSMESPDLSSWSRAPLDHGQSAKAGRPASLPDNLTHRSFVFQERRPFHPGRFHAFLAEPWAGVLRVRGTLWMASRPELVCGLDVAGASRNIKPEGLWWASVPTADRPKSTQFQQYINAIWHPKFGDRHQNLSFKGVDVDEADLIDRLEATLLTQNELESPDQWASIPDPFEWPQVSS